MKNRELKLYMTHFPANEKMEAEIGAFLAKECGVKIHQGKGIYESGRINLNSLSKLVQDVDGAVVLLQSDRGDMAGNIYERVGDVIQLGAFIGRMGPEKTVVVVIDPNGYSNFSKHLLGSTILSYDPEKPMSGRSALRQWCEEFPLIGRGESSDSIASAIEGMRTELRELPTRLGSLYTSCEFRGKCAAPAGISYIHETRDLAYEAIMERMKAANSAIDIIGIALRPYFHHGREYCEDVLKIMKEKEDVKWRILVLDPMCEQALYRSQREDKNIYAEARADDRDRLMHLLKKTTLFSDIETTIKQLNFLSSKISEKRGGRGPVMFRTYFGPPVCFAVLIDNRHLFLEIYHFGSDIAPPWGATERVSGRIPVFEFGEKSTMLSEIKGHFEYLWTVLSRPARALKEG